MHVAETPGFDATGSDGLPVPGFMVINNNPTPVKTDYVTDANTLKQTAGKVVSVTITPKANKSPGTRTIWYEGTIADTPPRKYERSTTPPQEPGEYIITFDVAAATGSPNNWNAVTGLIAEIEIAGVGGSTSREQAILTVLAGVKSDNITIIGWDDEKQEVTINNGQKELTTTTGNQIFELQPDLFEYVEWFLNGVSTNNKTNTYNFTNGQKGKYTVSVLVSKEFEDPDTGVKTIKWFNADVVLTVAIP